MISIVIASINPISAKNIEKNIDDTIGVTHEIIIMNNQESGDGICKLYNEAAQKAKYEIICFSHDDISIKSKNWGYTVLKLFQENNKLGILGVAGCSYKTFTPSGWDVGESNANVRHINYVQGYKYSNKQSEYKLSNPDGKQIAPVICIDGMWFCTRKNIVLNHPFDQDLLKGFHGYDLDISMKMKLANKKVAVSHEILIAHFSEGAFNLEWIRELFKFHSIWNKHLPYDTQVFSERKKWQIEKSTFKSFLNQALEKKIPPRFLFETLWQKKGIIRFSFKLFVKLNFYLLKRAFT